MSQLLELLPLLTMILLVVCSAFFSASEAALFYLRASERRALAEGATPQRAAAALLDDPDRLLSAVLFWNLVVNIAYFALASIVALRIETNVQWGPSAAAAFGLGALLAMIFFSEMLPKSLAVIRAPMMATVVALPLSLAVRVLDPLMPVLRLVNLLSRRLIWPNFKTEPYLEVADVERAIEISTSDAHLIEQERAVLANIVALSEIRVDEWMRPRTQFLQFRPPVSIDDLEGRLTPSGYLLVSEPDSDEIAAALHLPSMSDVPREHLEHYAEPVVYVPWCATVADALEQMKLHDRDVAAIVNEFGETIGVLTFDDLLDTIFNYSPSRSKRLLDLNPIHDVSPGIWLVAGVTSLRRLARYLDADLPDGKSVTVGGVVQEMLGRLAEPGDKCRWGAFQLEVLEVPHRGHMLLKLTRMNGGEAK